MRVKAIGGSMASSAATCTHLITDRVRRTAKFLACLARGVPIVTDSWLDASYASRRALPVDSYLLSDRKAERKYKFNLTASLASAADAPVFVDMAFLITDSVVPPPDMLTDIISQAGGTVLSPKDIAFSEASQIYVVTCPKDRRRAKSLSPRDPLVFVTPEFVLSGILQQAPDPSQHAFSL